MTRRTRRLLVGACVLALALAFGISMALIALALTTDDYWLPGR